MKIKTAVLLASFVAIIASTGLSYASYTGQINNSFQSNGSYLNVASVTSTSTNSALPSGTNVVLYNYGGYKIIYALSASGSSTVTTATADGVLQPGATIEVAVGSNTNIAYATTAAGLTSSLQAVGGAGLWTGSTTNNVFVGQTGLTAPSFAGETGGLDNSGFLQPFGSTAAGTSSTHNAVAIQGITSGVPVTVTGSITASFSQFAPNGNYSTPLSVGPTSTRTALPSGGGSTVAVYNVGSNAAFVILGNTSVVATASDDQVAPGGFICFSVGSNVDIAAIETAGATTLNISGGAGGCAGSGGGGGSGGNVSVIAVPADATVAGSPALTAADAASTSITGAGGQVIWTGSPTANSAETFGLNTYQGALISARGTFTNTTTIVVEGTLDNAAAQTGGTAKWVPVPVVIPGQAVAASSFTAPFEQAALTAAGLQGVRCRVTAYTVSDSIICTVRTTLAEPGNALQGISSSHPLSVASTVIQANASVPINISTAVTTQLVALVSGKAIDVTAWDAIANGTTTFTLEYGTGTLCASGTTALTGPYGLVAQFGAAKGSGLGPVLVVPAGNALCAVNSAAIQVSGSLSYVQF